MSTLPRHIPTLLSAVAVLLVTLVVASASSAQVLPAPTAPPVPTANPAAVLWTAPAEVDPAPINAVSCPTKTLCVAVDRAGGVLTTTDPSSAYRASAWTLAEVDPNEQLTDIACPSANLCVAVDAAGDAVTSTDPVGGAAAWQMTKVDPGSNQGDSDTAGDVLLRGVSCPTTSFCVAVDVDGDAVVTQDPTGGTSAWQAVGIDPNRRAGCPRAGLACQAALTGVSCPTVSLCAATDFSGNLLTSTDPDLETPWPSGRAGSASLWAIACPTTTFCATVDGEPGHVITFDPGDPTALHATALGGAASGVWCPSASLCLASAQTPQGLAVTFGSADPGAPHPTWVASPVGGLDGVACPGRTVCVGVDDDGGVLAGAQTTALTTTLRSELLPTTHLPTVATLLRAGHERFAVTSPVPATVTLVWTVTAGGATTTLATVTHRFAAPGPATLTLRLTSAGRRLLTAARTKLTVQAAATVTTSSGSLTRTRALTLALGRRATRHGPRRALRAADRPR